MSDERAMGVDLLVVPFFHAHDASPLDLTTRRRSPRGINAPDALEAHDLGVATGRENLAQALILRLMTPQGSLAALGHAGYGSQLYRLIGELKTDALRNLCRAYVLETVAQEPRVEPTAVALTFDPAAETQSSFVFTLEVQPRADVATLLLNLEVGL
jgi:phage baseplate assembly protein W